MKRTQRGDLEIPQRAGVAPNPIGGPRDTDTCALQCTASIIHRYLVTNSSYNPTVLSMRQDTTSEKTDLCGADGPSPSKTDGTFYVIPNTT